MRAALNYWKYELIRTMRDRRFFLLTLGMPVIFYFVFINQQGGALRIAGTFWSHYFMVSMASFGVVGSSINTLGVRLAAERQSGWVRYLRTTPLSSFGYALAKILTQLTLSLLIILCIFLVAHFSQNVSLSGGAWLAITLWLWIGSLPFAALGVFIGLTGNAAQPLGTLMYLVASMLGGLWTPIQVLPSVMQTIAKWTIPLCPPRVAHPGRPTDPSVGHPCPARLDGLVSYRLCRAATQDRYKSADVKRRSG